MNLEENFKISNSLKINSIADYGVCIGNLDELPALYAFIASSKTKYFILGEGTNLVPPNRYKGLVISLNFNSILNKGEHIRVGSSVNWNRLVKYAVNNNIYGFENLSLIPGSVGAAPIQNIGAYGVDVKPLIHRVYFFDLDSGEYNSFNSDECRFDYRESALKGSNKIITHIDFKSNLEKKLYLDYKSLSIKIKEISLDEEFLNPQIISKLVTQIREDVLPNPSSEPNVGSFFKNPIVDPSFIKTDYFDLSELVIWELENNLVKVGAARLIQLIKNDLPEFNNVSISKKHNLVITTNGMASQENVIALASAIQLKVKHFFDLDLEIEPRVIN